MNEVLCTRILDLIGEELGKTNIGMDSVLDFYNMYAHQLS